MELRTLLAQMTARDASDLHLAAGVPPVFRVGGELAADTSPNLTPESLEALLASFLPEDRLAHARRGGDFAVTVREDGRTFRCQVFRERGLLAAAVRILPDRVPTLDELHLPPVFERLTQAKRGLILLAGPAGSGKTTTLVSLVDHINQTRAERICTVEDPLHFVLSSKLSLVTQRVVGEDVESCERGLRAVMDSDPDVVLIGELRTPEAARLALELCETGHLVLTQMTAEGVPDALARLLALLGDPAALSQARLAESVQAVIAQKLRPREDGAGRVAVNEVLIGTPRVRQMIADGHTDAALLELAMEASPDTGMRTMAMSLRKLQEEGTIKGW